MLTVIDAQPLTDVSQDALRADLAILLHELRQPLQAAVWAAESARSTRDARGATRALEILRRQLDDVCALVEDLTTLQRDGRLHRVLRMAPIDFSSLVATIVEGAAGLAAPRGQTVRLAAPEGAVYVSGDAIRLSEVVRNLVENACRYSSDGAAIDCTIALEGDSVVLHVVDYGRGIAPDRLGRVFDLFERGGSDAPGQGIGLGVVRELVGLHGGSVSVKSEAGRGSDFIVRLPALAGNSP